MEVFDVPIMEKFITPIEYVQNSIEGTLIEDFVNDLNKLYSDKHMLGRFFDIGRNMISQPYFVSVEEFFDEYDLMVIKWLYRQYGWRIELTPQTKTNGDKVYMVSMFSLLK